MADNEANPIKRGSSNDSDPMLPVYILTGVFGAIFVIGPCCTFCKEEHRGIIRCCIMLSAFCMWIFWVTVYISQINPLIGPRMANTCVAWMAYQWGDEAK